MWQQCDRIDQIGPYDKRCTCQSLGGVVGPRGPAFEGQKLGPAVGNLLSYYHTQLHSVEKGGGPKDGPDIPHTAPLL